MSTIRKRSRRDDDDDVSYSNSGNNNTSHSNKSRGGSTRGGGSSDDIADRELFIGNITPGTTEEEFERFVADSMRQVNLIPPKGSNPIKTCRLNAKYGFIEFYSSEDCTAALNLNGVPFHGINLKFGRPSKYQGNVMHGHTNWQELIAKVGNNQYNGPNSSNDQNRNTQDSSALLKHPAFDPVTKVYRDIFVGNTNPEMTDAEIKEFLGNALLKFGMSNSGLENPVLEARNSGKYAFLIMRTVEDASNILNLNMIPYMKNQLKIERPSKFDGGIAGITFYNFDELYKLHMSGELRLMTSGPPSKIIMMKNMASIQEIQQDMNVFIELLEETRLECAQYGRVLNVICPRSIHEITNDSNCSNSNLDGNIIIDANSSQANYVPCRVFVEMASIDDAKQVILNMKGKTFNNNFVDMKFYPEEKFRKLQYNHESPGVVITSSFGPVFKEQALNATALAKIWSTNNPDNKVLN